MYRYVNFGFFGLLSGLFLTIPMPAYAVTVTAVNYGGVIATGSGVSYFFPTRPGHGTCAGQQPTVSIDSNRPAQAQLDYTRASGTLADPTTLLLFQIQNTVPVATIAGTTPPNPNSISIRVEIISQTGTANTPVPLVPLTAGLSWNNGLATDLDYGQADNALIQFGVSLADIPAATVGPSQGLALGYCSLLKGLSSPVGDPLLFCAPSNGVPPVSIGLNIGLIPAQAGGLGLTTSPAGQTDSTLKVGQNISVVLADCPEGANPTPVVAPTTNFNVLPFNFGVVPGDQRVKIANNAATPQDATTGVVPVTGVVIFGAPAGTPLNNSAPVQNVTTAVGGGVYTVSGLTNNTKYCFALGYVNAAGFVSTDTNWTSFIGPQPPASFQCATPAQIDGFLSRSTCFIASAAYGDEWDPRLEILRQFRDQILDHFAAGRMFTEWYYSWSPQAAHWLIENPSYKTFVRVLLMPTVEMARVSLWIRSNMWVFGVMLLLGTVMAATIRRRTT